MRTRVVERMAGAPDVEEGHALFPSCHQRGFAWRQVGDVGDLENASAILSPQLDFSLSTEPAPAGSDPRTRPGLGCSAAVRRFLVEVLYPVFITATARHSARRSPTRKRRSGGGGWVRGVADASRSSVEVIAARSLPSPVGRNARPQRSSDVWPDRGPLLDADVLIDDERRTAWRPRTLSPWPARS